MTPRSKALVTFLLIGTVVGVVTFEVSNNNLFQGFIGTENPDEALMVENSNTSQVKQLADLEPKLEISGPLTGNEDIIANATIENIGPGTIESGQTFTYTIYINGEESFSNTDSYVSMAPGDSFSFSYPIPKSIHQYENAGEVEFRLDVEQEIEEQNESNNSIKVKYDFSLPSNESDIEDIVE